LRATRSGFGAQTDVRFRKLRKKAARSAAVFSLQIVTVTGMPRAGHCGRYRYRTPDRRSDTACRRSTRRPWTRPCPDPSRADNSRWSRYRGCHSLCSGSSRSGRKRRSKPGSEITCWAGTGDAVAVARIATAPRSLKCDMTFSPALCSLSIPVEHRTHGFYRSNKRDVLKPRGSGLTCRPFFRPDECLRCARRARPP